MIDKMTEKIDDVKFELNLTNKYKYEVREIKLIEFNNVCEICVYLDNHDWEVFIHFIITNDKLTETLKDDLLKFSDKFEKINKLFDMNEIDSIFENYILL